MKRIICIKKPEMKGIVEKEDGGIYWIKLDEYCITREWMKESIPCDKEAWKEV